jgi:hypothetical protein
VVHEWLDTCDRVDDDVLDVERRTALLSHFGVTGSVSQRAEPLLRANGVDPHARYGSMALGAPDRLTSKARAEIRMQRYRYVSQREA